VPQRSPEEEEEEENEKDKIWTKESDRNLQGR